MRPVNPIVAAVLAVVGGALAGFGAAAAAAVTATGVMWLFIFGDDQWPPWTGPALNIAVVVIGLGVAAIVGWILFRRLCDRPIHHRDAT